jgi:hypothetical protein
LLRGAAQPHRLCVARERAARQAKHGGGGIGEEGAVVGDRAGEEIIDDDGGDRRGEPEGNGEQRLGDARCDDGEVRRMRLRDADEAVHDSPHRAEEADEVRGRANGGENAGAARDPAARPDLDPLEARGDALLDAVGRRVGRELQLDTDWRAVCGKTARTVRRAGRAKLFPTPVGDRPLRARHVSADTLDPASGRAGATRLVAWFRMRGTCSRQRPPDAALKLAVASTIHAAPDQSAL